MTTQVERSEKKLTTGRFKLPDNIISNIERMRLIGIDKPDLLVYTDRLDELTAEFAKLGFSKVERKFQLHVSSSNEDNFKKLFSNLIYEVRPTSNDRFIATVTVDTMEEYTKYLELDDQSNGCRIKPYKPRFASVRDDSSDTNDNSDQYQRQSRSADTKSKSTNTSKGKGRGGKGYNQNYGRGGGGGGGSSNYGKGNRTGNNSQSNDI
jgi:hypothetical protein